MFDNYLANTKGQKLLSHLRAISIVGKHLAESLGLEPKYVKAVEIACKSHDIGKLCNVFAKYINNTKKEKEPTAEDEHFEGPYHNELSWWILQKGVLNFLSGMFNNHIENDSVRRLVLDAVFWHHPRSENDSWKNIDIEYFDVPLIESFCSELFGSTISINEEMMTDSAPLYHDNANYQYNMIIRGVLIAADRYVSSISVEECDRIANGEDLLNFKELQDMIEIDLDLPEFTFNAPKTQRDADQQMCAKVDGNIVQVNAPTALGKTRIGVMRTMHRRKRAYWVCPRNIVAEQVYENIINELKALNGEISVELFLTGNRVACNNENVPVFSSDIVVTNIDNLLKPMISSQVADHLYKVLNADIVFDEFHEFVSDTPLFTCFVELMKMRTKLKDRSTMLLSATPMKLAKLWYPSKDLTVYLPGKGRHFQAAYSDPIHLYFTKSEMPEYVPGGMVMYNSIANTQKAYFTCDNLDKRMIAHSKYIKIGRKCRMDEILKKFGIGGDGVLSRYCVYSAHVLKAAVNVSFREVHISCGGAEMTLQAMRSNRFGELGEAVVHVHHYSNFDGQKRGEMAAINASWDTKLCDGFYNYMKEHFGEYKCTNMDEIYVKYNEYLDEYEEDYRKLVKDYLKIGSDKMEEFAPTRKAYSGKKDKKKQTNNTGKSLRNPDGSYNYIIKNENEEWISTDDCFSVGEKEFNKMKKIGNDMEAREWERLLEEVGYFELKKKMQSKSFDIKNFKWCKNPQTPFPFKGEYYHNELGVVDSDLRGTYSSMIV